jgi:hypothetical protein
LNWKSFLEELQEKSHPIDSSAAAAILYKAGKTIFKYDYEKDSMHFMNVRSELKYIKEGLSWANFEVPYYVGYESMSDDVVKFRTRLLITSRELRLLKLN